jgi:ligand-binding SRPBCC domain-containing protein
LANHTLRREQWIDRPIEEVFEFFSEAGNLEAMTPPWLGFRILTPQPVVMVAGARIHYRIRWHGLPLSWLTEIVLWNPPTEFVDVQLWGPYRIWHHTHRFTSVRGGTQMVDEVRYALRFRPFDRLVHRFLVKSALDDIFAYRAAKMVELLGNRSAGTLPA